MKLILHVFALLFLVSGAAGLIYEIVWERLLELYFGVTMISVTLIVSAYMAGLGLGSLLGGRIARNFRNTLLLYSLLEMGIAIFGVLSPRIIIWIGQATAGSPYILVFLISFAILLIPTTLMGMTLPLLTQSFVNRVETSGQVIGLLYGINTLGAALGGLLAGYIIIGFYGFDGTVYIAALLNAIVGLVAFALARGYPALVSSSEDEPVKDAAVIPWGYGTILLSSFLVGFIGLGFEMLWIRILLIINKNTAYAFPSILFVFLLGLALGGYFWGRKADTSPNLVALFCKIELAGAAVAVFTFLLFGISIQFDVPWFQNFLQTQKPLLPFVEVNHQFFFSKRALLSSLWNYFLPILIVVFPASLVMGGGLPVLDRLSMNSPRVAGRRVGDIHLANIIGSVAGSLVVSFLLLPAVGSEWTLRLLALSVLFFPFFYFCSRAREQSTLRRGDIPLFFIGALVLIGIVLLPGRGAFYQRLYSYTTRQEVVVSESGDSVLALTFAPGSARQSGWFWIGGEINSFFPPQGVYEERALVCAGAARPKRILIIGFGGGYSTLFYSNVPGVEEIVIVELLGDIAPFLTHNMDSARVTLEDPRLRYYVDDGRRYLNAFPHEKFDLISIDPLRDHTAGHNNLYSEEALKLYQNHLTPNGVLCAWMNEFHTIPHTVARVFPHADQYHNEFMVAGNRPIHYDMDYMERAVADYADLVKAIYPPGTEVDLSTSSALRPFQRDRDEILKDEKDGSILRDMHPQLEYYLFRAPAPTQRRFKPNPEVIVNFESRIR